MANQDELEGKAKEGKGSLKEVLGNLTGNDRLQAEGKADKTEGKAQGVVGKVKDAAKKAGDTIKDATKQTTDTAKETTSTDEGRV